MIEAASHKLAPNQLAHSLIFMAALTLTAIITISTAQAEPDPCAPMFDALTKMVQTPNHQFMSQSSATDALEHGGKLRTGESISTTDASYVKVNNQWHKVPFTPQDMLKQQEETRRNAKSTCHYVRDDAAEGDAKVYEAHNETAKGKSDIQVWISKANGLPLREEIDLDLERGGKSHSSVRFDYDHVAPPAEIIP